MWLLHALPAWSLGFALAAASPTPITSRQSGGAPWLAIDSDFPDPSFLQAPDGSWYAFGTNGNNRRVQVAVSSDFHSWTLTDVEALPTLAPWETAIDHWAPDVIRRDDGRYVMYYSGEARSQVRHHCVGVAISVSTSPLGPYIPNDEPLSCRLDRGGSIDPAGFRDTDGSRYVLFKLDGNSIGNGGDCNNGNPPILDTPIMLQPVEEDGFTLRGDAIEILHRSTEDGDGPLVEAPSMVLVDGVYYLFYSTHCFTDVLYDVRFATATSVTGPFEKGNESIVRTGDFGLTSPGGATVWVDGDGGGERILFHGFCREGVRCTYAAELGIGSGTVSFV
ncbi:glycoside hydrolase family 43 protein [Aspergillus granulosus]|uniref:Glycoside hydrolase family 43 protein n=1 Tax=Aspergillus granulosus TaxID=176169 RepID=A0ABR4HPB3_9EURO